MSGDLNFLAVLAGAILYMVYGGVYYSVLLKDKNENQDLMQNQSAGPGKYIYSVIAAFILSFLLQILLQATGTEGLAAGMGIGFIIGLLISIVYVKNSLFGLVSRKSLFIALGDHLVIFTLIGAIQGGMV